MARGPQKTTRLVRGGPLVTIILSNRTITRDKVVVFMTKKPVVKFSTEDLIVSEGRGK